jgi:hypothetical protein
VDYIDMDANITGFNRDAVADAGYTSFHEAVQDMYANGIKRGKIRIALKSTKGLIDGAIERLKKRDEIKTSGKPLPRPKKQPEIIDTSGWRTCRRCEGSINPTCGNWMFCGPCYTVINNLCDSGIEDHTCHI